MRTLGKRGRTGQSWSADVEQLGAGDGAGCPKNGVEVGAQASGETGPARGSLGSLSCLERNGGTAGWAGGLPIVEREAGVGGVPGLSLREPRSRYEPDGPCDPEFPCVPELPCVPAAFAACPAACAAAFACRCPSELVRPGLSGLTFRSAS
jgi:hypothetical protein